MKQTRFLVVAGLSLTLLLAACGPAATPAPSPAPSTPAPAPAPAAPIKVTLMVGGLEKIIYLPAKLTESLGYFKDEGLEVTLMNEPAGVDAENEMLAGKIDGTVGFYDHNIDLQSKGKKTVDVVIFGGSPGEYAMVSKDAPQVKGVQDLKGSIIGVTGLGSSTNFLAAYLVVRGGNKVADYTPIAVGAGDTLIAAMQTKKINVAITTQPTVARLLKTGQASILVDMSDKDAAAKSLGGVYPASSLYMMQDYVAKNPATVQKLANAFVKTLRWINSHSADEIAAKMPQDYYAGDKELYLSALNASLSMFTKDGRMPDTGPDTVLKVLSTFKKDLDPSKIDLKATYTTQFVDKVPK